MKDYKHIEHMRNLNDSLIWERMKRCYDYGYDDARAESVNKPSEKVPEELVIMLAKIFGGIGDYEDITIGELIEAMDKGKMI